MILTPLMDLPALTIQQTWFLAKVASKD
ncbi:hypothetical protein Pan2_27 [Pseudanabaena phage Pan2]|nr:hypothetical protein Pan2_27 [Pseudanabaena phage Pan2]